MAGDHTYHALYIIDMIHIFLEGLLCSCTCRAHVRIPTWQPRIQEFAMGGAVYQRCGNVCEAVWTEEGGAVRLRRGGGGGGGGGCSRQVTLINSSLTCTHSLLKHKKHHGKRVHSAPALSCSTASLTFVRTTELSGLLSMAQHVICRSLSSGRGGGGRGRQKLPGGGISYAMGGGGRPPQGYAGSGAATWCSRFMTHYSFFVNGLIIWRGGGGGGGDKYFNV